MAIRGQHIYKDQWAPSKGIKVTCFKDTRSEAKNTIYTRNGENALVGHVPIEISQLSQLMTNFVSYRGTCIHGWLLCKTNENHQMARTKLPFLIEITDFSRVLSEMARTKRTSGNLWPYSSFPVAAVLKKPKRFRPGTVSGISKASQETCCIHAKRVTITP